MTRNASNLNRVGTKKAASEVADGRAASAKVELRAAIGTALDDGWRMVEIAEAMGVTRTRAYAIYKKGE